MLREIDDALEINREMGETFVTGFVVIRGEDCGQGYHGKFIKISNARNQLQLLPPFNDCNYYNCGCEIVGVVKGETAREVLREYTA